MNNVVTIRGEVVLSVSPMSLFRTKTHPHPHPALKDLFINIKAKF